MSHGHANAFRRAPDLATTVDARPSARPGSVLWVGTGIAAVLLLDASSRDSFGLWAVAAVLSVLVAGGWTISLLRALRDHKARAGRRLRLVWLAVPLALGTAFLLARSDIPFDVRLSLSRGAMDQVAAEVIAGGTTDRGWIGLYPVERVERLPNGVRFLVTAAGFIDRLGFAYASTGMPANVDGNDDYRRLGDGWWIWLDRF